MSKKDYGFEDINNIVEAIGNFTDSDINLFVEVAKEKGNVEDEMELRRTLIRIIEKYKNI